MAAEDSERQVAPDTVQSEAPRSETPAPAALGGSAAATIGSGLLQRKVARRLARKAAGAAEAPGADDAVARAAGSAGAPLPDGACAKLEGGLGADLSGVRVHTGPASQDAAAAVDAKAYTVGQDIHFGAGQFNPGTGTGDHLIAHEAVHTVQQSLGGASTPQAKLEVSQPGDAAEHEADHIADSICAGDRSGAAPSPVAQKAMRVTLQRDPQNGGGQTGQTSAKFLMLNDLVAAYDAGQAAIAQAGNDPAKRRAAVVQQRAQVSPKIAAIRAAYGNTPNLWRYDDIVGDPTFEAKMEDKILACLQLEAAGDAEDEWRNNQGPANESPADKATRLAKLGARMQSEGKGSAGDDWCGEFASAQFAKVGMAEKVQRGFFSTDSLLPFFQYKYDAFPDRIHRWIEVEGRWLDTKTYHGQRSSLRQWNAVQPGSDVSALDIRAGDIVLIDNRGALLADHIEMVQSWNPATKELFTLGGNSTGYVVSSGGSAPQAGSDEQKVGTDLADASGTAATVKKDGQTQIAAGVRNMGNEPAPTVVAHGVGKPSRVVGFGRLSLVDFEQHGYDPGPAKPRDTAPPAAQNAKPTGPDLGF